MRAGFRPSANTQVSIGATSGARQRAGPIIARLKAVEDRAPLRLASAHRSRAMETKRATQHDLPVGRTVDNEQTSVNITSSSGFGLVARSPIAG